MENEVDERGKWNEFQVCDIDKVNERRATWKTGAHRCVTNRLTLPTLIMFIDQLLAINNEKQEEIWPEILVKKLNLFQFLTRFL